MVVEGLHCFGPTSLSGVRRRFSRAVQGVMSGWVKDFAFGFDQMFDASPCYGVPVHCWHQVLVERHFTTWLLKLDMHYLHLITYTNIISRFGCKHVYRMQQRLWMLRTVACNLGDSYLIDDARKLGWTWTFLGAIVIDQDTSRYPH